MPNWQYLEVFSKLLGHTSGTEWLWASNDDVDNFSVVTVVPTCGSLAVTPCCLATASLVLFCFVWFMHRVWILRFRCAASGDLLWSRECECDYSKLLSSQTSNMHAVFIYMSCDMSHQPVRHKHASPAASSSLLGPVSVSESLLRRGSNRKWFAASWIAVIPYFPQCFYHCLWMLMMMATTIGVANTCLHVRAKQTKYQLQLQSLFYVVTWSKGCDCERWPLGSAKNWRALHPF